MSDKYCILQDDLKDCGVSSLLSIIKYYGGYVSKECLREMTKTTKDGVSALNLLRCARELGFEGYGIKGKLRNIKNDLLPIICHVTIDKKINHFVVLYKIDLKKNRVLIMDPAKGYIYLSFSEFQNISTGYFLILKPKQIIPLIKENNQVKSFIMNTFIKYKNVLISILFMSLIYILLNILTSYNFKLLLNEISISKENDIKFIFIFLIIAVVFKYVIFLFRTNLINYINFILDKTLVKKAYYHIINLPYLYYRSHSNGDLLTRINDLSNVKELISSFIVTMFVDLLLGVIVLFVLFNINVVLSIIVIVSIVSYILLTFAFNKYIHNSISESIKNHSIVNNYLVESLSSFETIKNLSIQDYVVGNFNKKYDNYCNVNNNLLKIINIENMIKNLLLSLMNLIIIYKSFMLIKNGEINITSLITYISVLNYLIDSIKNILDLQIIYESSKESLRRIKEVLNVPIEKLIFNKKTNIKCLLGRIEISDVSYSYNGINNVLYNVNLNIQESEKVLIYGNSGSGKSTLMQIIIGYLDNNYTGNITIGGMDLKKVDLHTLRSNICYVSQQEYLYTDTVYENIVLDRKISYVKFDNLCKNLLVDEIVKHSSLAYNYLIENNGDNISGGEKERIIIARSMLTNANLYIFDESFSHLDIEMERKILKYLFENYHDKTFIVISHRKSNLDLYNQIIRVGKGVYVREEN